MDSAIVPDRSLSPIMEDPVYVDLDPSVTQKSEETSIHEEAKSKEAKTIEELLPFIPEENKELFSLHEKLDEIARMCDTNFASKQTYEERGNAIEENKLYGLQALGCVKEQIETLSRNMISMLDLQAEKTSKLSQAVEDLELGWKLHEEKNGRIATCLAGNGESNGCSYLFSSFSSLSSEKTTMLEEKPESTEYVRTSIDYSMLDNVGHGTKEEPKPCDRHTMIVLDNSTVEKIYEIIPISEYEQREGKKRIEAIEAAKRISMTLFEERPMSVQPATNDSGSSLPLDETPVLSEEPPASDPADAEQKNLTPKLPEPLTTVIEEVVAIFDYAASKPDEMNLVKGDIINVYRKEDDGWYWGTSGETSGFFPSNYVKSLE